MYVYIISIGFVLRSIDQGNNNFTPFLQTESENQNTEIQKSWSNAVKVGGREGFIMYAYIYIYNLDRFCFTLPTSARSIKNEIEFFSPFLQTKNQKIKTQKSKRAGAML
jgi:hypothetical protein